MTPLERLNELRLTLSILYLTGENDGMRFALKEPTKGKDAAIEDAMAAILRWEGKK